jgi:hypothetical protein
VTIDAVDAQDLGADLVTTMDDPIQVRRPRYRGPAIRPIASVTVRSVALIAVALLLILVLLPAVLGAAGP